jgi:hypothetical protein
VSEAEVLVLGCGPAGLLAAYAAESMGYKNIVIASKKRPSHLYGCQYLHGPIPGLVEGEGTTVSYELMGTVQGYSEKVYGNPNVITSPTSLGREHQAWNLRAAYSRLWAKYADAIVDTTFEDWQSVEAVVQAAAPLITFSTLPAPLLCKEGHDFLHINVWAVGDAPDRGIFVPLAARPWSVVCNGEKAPRWYRTSNVFGHSTVEWPWHPKPPVEGIAAVTKPIATRCDCQPKVHRLGRYGQWRKGTLVHQAYGDVRRMLSNTQLGLF